jgi:hypothetical protein
MNVCVYIYIYIYIYGYTPIVGKPAVFVISYSAFIAMCTRTLRVKVKIWKALVTSEESPETTHKQRAQAQENDVSSLSAKLHLFLSNATL